MIIESRLRRVLIIDDHADRHAWCRDRYRHGHSSEVTSCTKYSEVIACLESATWDVLLLDHDLADGASKFLIGSPTTKGLEENPDPFPGNRPERQYYDGRDIVDWLIANPARCPRFVWIHSWADAAVEMESRLARNFPDHVIMRKQAPV